MPSRPADAGAIRGLRSAASLKHGHGPRLAHGEPDDPRTQIRGLIEARIRPWHGPPVPYRRSADSDPRPH